MTEKNVHPDLLPIALDKVEGFAFERFAQDFLAALEGKNFVPFGGTGDGGADGVYESATDDRRFYQFTRQENHRDKIRKTHKRLVDFGRKVKSIYYLSSREIPHTDKEEDLLSDELDTVVKIRERKYIGSHINDSTGTRAAFHNHLLVYTNFLRSLAQTQPHSPSENICDPSVYVFLQHEVTNRRGDRKLVHSLTDSLLIWALSDTDPDAGKFLMESQIVSRIFENFPWAEKIIKPHLASRLNALSQKGNETGREIRCYRKESKYCLPYETRETIKAESQVDEVLKINFNDELKRMASDLFDADDGEYSLVSDICCKAIHDVFEQQGLLFSHFISSENDYEAPLVVSDCIQKALEETSIVGKKRTQYFDYIEEIIKNGFLSRFRHPTYLFGKFVSNIRITFHPPSRAKNIGVLQQYEFEFSIVPWCGYSREGSF